MSTPNELKAKDAIDRAFASLRHATRELDDAIKLGTQPPLRSESIKAARAHAGLAIGELLQMPEED